MTEYYNSKDVTAIMILYVPSTILCKTLSQSWQNYEKVTNLHAFTTEKQLMQYTTFIDWKGKQYDYLNLHSVYSGNIYWAPTMC